MITLDVIVPTYNRCQQLQETVASLLRAEIPAGLAVTIIVVDNNCTDDTASLIEQVQPLNSVRLRYVKETKQGLSHARNAGIAAGRGELIGFIDDDEQIDRTWYEVIEREFRDSAVEFIGGPCQPLWGANPPDWLPPGHPSVIGVVSPQSYSDYNENFPGILMGGNAVIRRSVFQRVEGYSPRLGRTNKGLLSVEDAEFYRRLLQNGVRGRHVPDLIIHHYVPPERLTKKYHRRWCFWHGVSLGLLDKTDPRPVVYFAGVPRYLIGSVVRSLYSTPRNLLAGKAGEAFEDELAFWDLAGFFYGKHWFTAETAYESEPTSML
jgi:glucosyl-dolichyl phosphate glucuronosyltransferase